MGISDMASKEPSPVHSGANTPQELKPIVERYHFVPMPYSFNIEQFWQPRSWKNAPIGMPVHVVATGAVMPRRSFKDQSYGYVMRNVESGETVLFYSPALFVNRVRNWRTDYPSF